MMRPQFYDKFLCIGDKCTDNCCIGWEIDIDKPAMERFAKIPGEFGERLRSAIHGGEWRYEHIAVYFLYRHFTDCLSDGAVYARTMVACCSAAAVMLMDCMRWKDSGALSEWDRILDLKLYSKQVEYSEENTAEFIAEYD